MLRTLPFWLVISAELLLSFVWSLASPLPVGAQDTAPGREQVLRDSDGDSLPAGAVLRLGTLRFRHRGEALAVAFSPDGKLLAATCKGGLIYLWDAKTGKKLHRLPAHERRKPLHHVYAIDFSPDGKFLASRWTDNSIRIFDVSNGKEILTVVVGEGMPREFGQVQFSPDGKAVIAEWTERKGNLGPIEARVSFFDSRTGKELRRLEGMKQQAGPFGFSADGKLLAVKVFADQVVQLRDATTGQRIRDLPTHELGRTLAFSPDSRLIALGATDRIMLLDIVTGKEVGKLDAPMDVVMGLSFTPDGKSLISASQDGKVSFWNVAASKVRFQRDARLWMIRSMTLSRDGRMLAVGGVYNAIRLWDGTGQELFQESKGHDAAIEALAFAPNGKQLATGSENRELCLWDMPAGSLRRRFDTPNSVRSLAFAPDGKVLAAVFPSSRVVRLWDADTGKIAQEFSREGLGARCVAFAPDGNTLLTAHSGLWHGQSQPTGLNVWAVKSGKHVREYPLQTASLETMAYASDGQTVVLGAGDGEILVWDLQAGKALLRLQGHRGWVTSIALSADGRTLASGGTDHTVRLWELPMGREICALHGHEQPIGAVALSPDGRLLATGSGTKDNSASQGPHPIKFWEMLTAKEIFQLQDLDSDVTTLAFAPDGLRLASGLQNSSVLIWEVRAAAGCVRVQPHEVGKEELQRCWEDLAGTDAARAYRAIGVLVAGQAQTVGWLKSRLRPAPAIDRKQVSQAIAELDSARFVVREGASRQLAGLREQAEPQLRMALEGNPPAEVQSRIKQLLNRPQGIPAPETLRALRAIQVLEQIGSVEARNLLEILAKGEATARASRDAKASLARLAKSRSAAP